MSRLIVCLDTCVSWFPNVHAHIARLISVRISKLPENFVFRTGMGACRQFGNNMNFIYSRSFLFAETIITDPAQVPCGVRHTGKIFFVLQGVHLTEGASEGLVEPEESVLDYW